MTQPKRISLFGATGSIGQSTIDLIARDPDAYDVVAVTGGRNIVQLAEDARRLNADIAVTAFDDELDALRDALAGSGIEAAAGQGALVEAACRPADWTMSAIIGYAGLAPGLKALEQGATLALANKESLVCAGSLMKSTAAQHGATLMPVDSEHSAVFQALQGEDISAVEKIIITASGGAFRDWPLEDLPKATPEQASTHPNWNMGQRITIDSASMFNKAMELIETKEFFDVSASQIEALIHPQSLIHAIVAYRDGGMISHVGPHDMRHAIGYALNYPERQHLPVERLDLAKIGALNFQPADETRWPALRLAREVMEAGGLSGAVFNAAKEVAMDAFLDHQIRFTDMAAVVEDVLNKVTVTGHTDSDGMTLDLVAATDAMARRVTREVLQNWMVEHI